MENEIFQSGSRESDEPPPSSWKHQLTNRITTFEQLQSLIKLNPDELEFFKSSPKFKFSITPYYLATILADPTEKLRKCMIPSIHEHSVLPSEFHDPLAEEKYRKGCLIHRYPDRVLFLLTSFCSSYCRYCTRSRLVTCTTTNQQDQDAITEAVQYISDNPSIHDVIISGGDPLTLDDNKLQDVLSRLRKIPHVQMIRIGTKVPAVLPQRVTNDLVSMLKEYRPIWMNLHFAHPSELTEQCKEACLRLSDAGIPLFSQTVLLKGVNDDVQTLTELFKKLITFNVKPYYLYHCDMVEGTSHFRTTIQHGLELMSKLQGNISGYCIPQYIYDIPGGGGKMPLVTTQWSVENNLFKIKNFEGHLYQCAV